MASPATMKWTLSPGIRKRQDADEYEYRERQIVAKN